VIRHRLTPHLVNSVGRVGLCTPLGAAGAVRTNPPAESASDLKSESDNNEADTI